MKFGLFFLFFVLLLQKASSKCTKTCNFVCTKVNILRHADQVMRADPIPVNPCTTHLPDLYLECNELGRQLLRLSSTVHPLDACSKMINFFACLENLDYLGVSMGCPEKILQELALSQYPKLDDSDLKILNFKML